MKKIYLIIIISLLVMSCSKKKPILGERKNIFSNNNSSIQVFGNKEDIEISKAKTFHNYYGDSSTLNQSIENYKVDNLNFIEKSIFISNI